MCASHFLAASTIWIRSCVLWLVIGFAPPQPAKTWRIFKALVRTQQCRTLPHGGAKKCVRVLVLGLAQPSAKWNYWCVSTPDEHDEHAQTYCYTLTLNKSTTRCDHHYSYAAPICNSCIVSEIDRNRIHRHSGFFHPECALGTLIIGAHKQKEIIFISCIRAPLCVSPGTACPVRRIGLGGDRVTRFGASIVRAAQRPISARGWLWFYVLPEHIERENNGRSWLTGEAPFRRNYASFRTHAEGAASVGGACDLFAKFAQEMRNAERGLYSFYKLLTN